MRIRLGRLRSHKGRLPKDSEVKRRYTKIHINHITYLLSLCLRRAARASTSPAPLDSPPRQNKRPKPRSSTRSPRSSQRSSNQSSNLRSRCIGRKRRSEPEWTKQKDRTSRLCSLRFGCFLNSACSTTWKLKGPIGAGLIGGISFVGDRIHRHARSGGRDVGVTGRQTSPQAGQPQRTSPIAQPPPIHACKLLAPCGVSTVKLGASSFMCSISLLLWAFRSDPLFLLARNPGLDDQPLPNFLEVHGVEHYNPDDGWRPRNRRVSPRVSPGPGSLRCCR